MSHILKELLNISVVYVARGNLPVTSELTVYMHTFFMFISIVLTPQKGIL